MKELSNSFIEICDFGICFWKRLLILCWILKN